jgi:hypothetical protein
MNSKNSFLLFVLVCFKLTAIADIALPKKEILADTKYYFANVDSFSNCTFYIKKNTNNKTQRIKQSASFLLKENNETGDERLEVWAIRNDTKQKTNSFILQRVKPSLSHGGTTAHIAIQFYFDKKNNLNYKQTVMKPDCFKKKNTIPFFSRYDYFIHLFQFVCLSILSLAILVFIYRRRNANLQNAYV